MLLNDFLNLIEEDAPLNLALDWDRSGIQVAADKEELKAVGLCLDPSPDSIDKAVRLGCDLILSHHPLSIKPRLPDKIDSFHHILSLLLSTRTCLYSAHTSLDVNPSGPAGWLARELKLEQCRVILPTKNIQSEFLSFTPPLQLETDKISTAFEVQKVIHHEKRVSGIVLPREKVETFLLRLKEEMGLFSFERWPSPGHDRVFGLGIYGVMAEKIPFSTFINKLARLLELKKIICIGTQPEYVQKVGYCPGSGGDLASRAFALGADVFMSGDLKYHKAQEIEPLGFTLDVGHFILEEKMMLDWCRVLRQKAPGIQFHYIKGNVPLYISDIPALKSSPGED